MNRKPAMSADAEWSFRPETIRRPYQASGERSSSIVPQEEALWALQEAIRYVGTAIFDYIVELVVIVPAEWERAIVNDMQGNGKVYRSSPIKYGFYSVTSYMTLKDSFGYAARLKVLSQGTGSHIIRLLSRSRLSIVSPNQQP